MNVSYFRRYISIALLLLFAVKSIDAAPFNSAKLSLQDALQISLDNHPTLKVFPLRQHALAGSAQTARLNPVYRLGLDSENLEGSRNGNDEAEHTLALSSVFELGGKRSARIAAVESHRDQLDTEQRIAALDLLSEVARRFQQVIVLQAQLEASKQARRLAQQSLQAVNERVEAGATPVAEKTRATAEQLRSENRVTALEHRVSAARMALASSMGEPSASFGELSGNLYTQSGESADFVSLFNRASQSPDILRFASEQRIREAQLQLKRSQGQFDLQWSLGVRRLEGPQESALVAGVSVPLFSRGRNRGELIAAKAAIDEVGLEREAAILRLRATLYEWHQQLLAAQVNLQRLRTQIIPTLEQAQTEIDRAYRRGRYSYLELVSARRELIAAKLEAIDAASTTHTAQLEIERLIGEPLVSSASVNALQER